MVLLIELCPKSHLELRYIYVSSIQLSEQDFCYVRTLELAERSQSLHCAMIPSLIDCNLLIYSDDLSVLYFRGDE